LAALRETNEAPESAVKPPRSLVQIIQAEGMNDMQHESYSVSRVQAIIAELQTVELVGILVTAAAITFISTCMLFGITL
jgi:hypothetical protein